MVGNEDPEWQTYVADPACHSKDIGAGKGLKGNGLKGEGLKGKGRTGLAESLGKLVDAKRAHEAKAEALRQRRKEKLLGKGKGKGKRKGKGGKGRSKDAMKGKGKAIETAEEMKAGQLYSEARAIYEDSGNLLGAKKKLNEALDILPDYPPAIDLRAEVQSHLTAADDDYKQAQSRHKAGELLEAEDLCHHVLASISTHTEATQLLEKCEKQRHKAEAHLSKAMRLAEERHDFRAAQKDAGVQMPAHHIQRIYKTRCEAGCKCMRSGWGWSVSLSQQQAEYFAQN
eukprot:SAG31_NODE_2621_length_5362_cov_5.185256_1_plen_285_part_00